MNKILHRFILLLILSLLICGLPKLGNGQYSALFRHWDRVVYPNDSLLVSFSDPIGCNFNLLICSNSKVSLISPNCLDTIFMEPYSELTICYTGKTFVYMSHHCTLKIDTSFANSSWQLRVDSLIYDPLGVTFIDTSLGLIKATTAIIGLELNYYGYPAGQSPCDEASISEHFQSSLNLFPNPSGGTLNIDVPEGKNGYFDLRIFDIYGQLLREEKQFLPGHTNISDLSPGIYMIEAWNGKERIISSFVAL